VRRGAAFHIVFNGLVHGDYIFMDYACWVKIQGSHDLRETNARDEPLTCMRCLCREQDTT